MRRLVDADISDPVPVATGNKFVLCSQAYEAVFDFIVANIELEDIELLEPIDLVPLNPKNSIRAYEMLEAQFSMTDNQRKNASIMSVP